MPGKLLIIATPIGNLDDLSTRARKAFESSDLVACEDTRRTGRLLTHLGIKKKLVSLHEHNERQRLPMLLRVLAEDRVLALASDAGTPLLSDPGYVLVREALAAGVAVEHVPGASAVLAALVSSGLPPYPFTFLGFPPSRQAKRRSFLARFAELGHTIVFFESPHRLLPCLRDVLEVLGDRPAAIGRELTKLHEEVIRGSVLEALEELQGRAGLKGEFTVVLGAPTRHRHD